MPLDGGGVAVGWLSSKRIPNTGPNSFDSPVGWVAVPNHQQASLSGFGFGDASKSRYPDFLLDGPRHVAFLVLPRFPSRGRAASSLPARQLLPASQRGVGSGRVLIWCPWGEDRGGITIQLLGEWRLYICQ